jgi:hypothetical protein
LLNVDLIFVGPTFEASTSTNACFSSELPGEQNKVPFFPCSALFPKTALIEFKSTPEAITQAEHAEPGATALIAASIFIAIPPRPMSGIRQLSIFSLEQSIHISKIQTYLGSR